MKKNLLILALTIISLTVFAKDNYQRKNRRFETPQNLKNGVIKQTEFCYILSEDGCFYLCAITTTAFGPWDVEVTEQVTRYNHPGMNMLEKYCPYTLDEMETMC